MKKDYLVKALGYNGQVRAYAVRTTETVSEGQKRHDTWVNATAALGRAMTATVMMSAMLKGEEKLTVRIEGDGPIGSILVDGNAKGEVRGYVANPHVQLPEKSTGKIDVAGAVGQKGTLSVVKDVGLKDFFTGQVPLVSGELGEDFTYYFVTSEQIPSAVGVGVLVNPDHTVLAAGGFILQMMPGATEETIVKLEDNLKVIPPISQMVEQGLSPEEMLETILGEGEVQFLDRLDVAFHCGCNKERIETALIGLGKEELRAIIEEDGKAEVECHFCNEKHIFTKEELEKLVADL